MTTKGIKTKELNRLTFAYILDAIDSSGYGKETTTDTEKLQFLADCFNSEYVYTENLRRYGSYQKTFENWLRGLPSSFNIDFENYRIIEIAKLWGSIPQNATEAQEDKILSNWWHFIACKTFQLMKAKNVLPYIN